MRHQTAKRSGGRMRLADMRYTQRDLEVAQLNVVALEALIRKHRTFALLFTFDPELRPRADELLSQFEASLREAHSRYGEIWSDLHSADGARV